MKGLKIEEAHRTLIFSESCGIILNDLRHVIGRFIKAPSVMSC